MQQDNVILCGSNSYEKKYYLDENFESLPQAIKDELKIMCVLYTEEVGGILTLEFEEDGTLLLNVSADEDDLLYDEIGSVLKIKEIQAQKRELLEAIEMYYRVFFLKQDASAMFDEGTED